MADDAGKYDDFLKRTGATGTKPDYADFLARTGAVAAPEPETNTHFSDQGQNEYGITGDPQQFNQMKPGAAANALDRIGTAAVQGYNDTAPIFTPKMQAIVDQGPVGRYITNPLMHILGAVPAGFNALGAGTTQAVNEAATAAGAPTLARDINPLIMSGTAVMGGAPGVPLTRNGLVAREMAGPVAPRFVGEAAGEVTPSDTVAAPLPQAFRENPLAPGASIPQNMLAVRPGGEAVPQSVGAAASAAGESGITRAQELAYRSTAEGQKLLEPQPAGAPDRNLYVQGANPNSAEVEQTVNTARELKSLNMTSEAVSQEAKDVAAQNNDARALHFAQTSGSDVDVLNARETRAAQAEKDLAATWANKAEADASPVVDAAAQIKASPDGKRPLVRNAIDAVTKELFDKDGNLETNPEQLYGVRKHIDDLMSKEAGADDPKSMRAMANLGQLKATLDAVIEKAAPGFRQYLDNFAQASRRIDEMEVLQKHEPKLFDAQNRMTYNKVQTMMRQIVDSRQAPGINPYKSITDDTMARLWALRDDLRRSASAQELARTPGSDTAQNIWDAAKGVAGGMAGEAAIHGTANMLFGPLGSGVAAITKNVLGNMASGRTSRRQTARGMELLHPDPAKLHNPLAGP